MSNTPAVGFISLGCPKALVDSERILTQLSADGYAIVDTYENADVVIVNTCGFIDDAVAESLNTIGEAIAQNGKVIVTGCLGVKPDMIRGNSATAPENRQTLAFAAVGIPRGAKFPRLQLWLARALYLAFLRKDFRVVENMRLTLDGVDDPGVQAVAAYQHDLEDLE